MGRFVLGTAPRINGGCAITFIGEPYQVLVWQVVGLDPETEEETAPYGALTQTWTENDGRGRSINHYVAPSDPAAAGKTDRIKVSFAE